MKQKSKKTSVARLRRGRKLLFRARFLPAIFIAGFATFLSLQPYMVSAKHGVLAYATNTSAAGLLVNTNNQRTANGINTLTSNSLLASAAQAKANDMVNRNYWSHQTPDGQQPWVFITNAGYQYTAAGENLAYGFMTSSDTVTGWMNSPPHKENLLSVNFTEVGFGIANSPNYVGDGQQTVVVAMYGKPLGASTVAPTSTATSPAPTATKPAAKPTPTPAPTPAPVAEVPVTEADSVPVEEPIAVAQVESSEVSNVPASASPAVVRRIQLLGGNLDGWGATVVMLAVASSIALWLIHKGYHLRRYVLASEHFVTHHIHLDFTVIAVLYLAFVLLDTSGIIR